MIDVEADDVRVERQRPIDVGDGHGNEFESHLHALILHPLPTRSGAAQPVMLIE